MDLRCDYAVNPLGVDSPSPRLFWKLDGKRSAARSKRPIKFSSPPRAKELAQDQGDLWDSGKVHSDETIQIPYAGEDLKTSEQVFWKVRVWDENGKVSAMEPAGELDDGRSRIGADWRAKWIGAADTNIPSLLLRREFVVKPGLRRALVNVCGLGEYEMTLNGKKVGDDFLSPGWTKYNKTCLYDTRDITADLKAGKNAIGLELGNGMYNVAWSAGASRNSKARSVRKKPSRKSGSNMPTARWKSSARTKAGALRPARSRSLRFTAAKILTRGSCNAAGISQILTIHNGACQVVRRSGRRTARAFLRRAADS